ncbi:response regulator transcription factor [Patulibacter sp. SYSU D01012]|uniref:response regulator n=1 Tax=Patulibacter sp. SYSU D01012 TaxID=2817381 RepID=UPI001B312F68|nr:response regulator transcription factor [Patulibacter sp. SYSU D01012]
MSAPSPCRAIPVSTTVPLGRRRRAPHAPDGVATTSRGRLRSLAPLPLADRDGHAGVSVVVADDNERFREGLVRSIDTDPDVHVVGQAGDGASALELLVRTRPDVAVVDARMPVLGGIELARAVAQVPLLERTQVVLLSATLDRRVTAEADDAGVALCLDKGLSRRDIREAVVALAGENGRP